MYYVDEKVKTLCRVFDQNERSGYLRLDLNENPGGLPEDVVREVLNSITPQMIAQYPETHCFTRVLAEYLNVDSANLCLVNGSAEGIRYIIEAFTSPGGRIVGVVPSYFMFQVYSEMYGRKFARVPYQSDLTMDVGDIISELTSDTQMLILLNPNNPMGNAYTEQEVQAILEAAKEKSVTVLIDEAYHYFYPKTFMNYAIENEHIFVTRTFSKLFSMAGCRLGYVIGHPKSVEVVQKMCTPHNTNVLALKMAERVLTMPSLIEELIAKYTEGRSFLVEQLDLNGYMHKGEAGNFIFIKPKGNAGEVVKRMREEASILIKAYPNVGEYGDCLRVSIGEKKYMQRFMSELLKLDRS